MQTQERKIYVRLHGEITERFLRIKKHLGLENNTEVLRYVLNEFWRKHREELQEKKQGGEKT